MGTPLIQALNALADNLVEELSGSDKKSPNIIRIFNNDLAERGDLSFSHNLKVWHSLLERDKVKGTDYRNILDYYLQNRGIATEGKSDLEIAEQALQLLSSRLKTPLKIHKLVYKKNCVCVHLERSEIIDATIKKIIEEQNDFGNWDRTNTSTQFSVSAVLDERPDRFFTNFRLQLLCNFATSILRLQGYDVLDSNSKDENPTIDNKFLLTTRKENCEKNGSIYTCGIVKVCDPGKFSHGIDRRSMGESALESVISSFGPMSLSDKEKKLNGGTELWEEEFIEKCIAKATVSMRLLSVNPKHDIVIRETETFESSGCTKVATIIYNFGRISVLIDKYHEKVSSGEYPELPNINEVDFSLLTDQMEWELIFNYILRYPLIVSNCVKHNPEFEIRPRVLCDFLQMLSNRFGTYYSKVKVLTEAREQLIPVLMARLYLLKALQTLLYNVFRLLDIPALHRM